MLIPRYTARGSALACLFTQAFVAGGQVFLARRTLSLRIRGRFLLRILLFLPIVMAGGWGSSRFFGNWYLGLILLLAWSGLAAVSLRLVRIGDLLKLLPVPEE